jgi:seryl-tRNA synthetase
MLDPKYVRENLDEVKANLKKRRSKLDLTPFEALDARRRELIQEGDTLRQKRNATNDQIKNAKKEGRDVGPIIAEMKQVSERIKTIENESKQVDLDLSTLMYEIPNMLDPTVPEGNTENDNQVVRVVGDPPVMDFEPKDHVDLGEALGILDMKAAAKISGSRFALLKGAGAKLERALISFFLDLAQSHGYTEVLPPVMVNTESMTGTGQLPKFAEDSFRVEGTDLWLIPTAEVPVTNIHRDEILSESDLPIRYCAYSSCFRSEAGSYGKDTRGLIRQHQFNKVELVKFTHPDKSQEEHEALTANAEQVLKKLGLAYRVVALCSADVGFSAAKCYDLEVYLPSFGGYREISSCSNFLDFQARRAKIRFRPEGEKGTRFVHTINGSGLAVGRTWLAIVENYQRKDGSVAIPEALLPYMGGIEVIEPLK